MNVPLANFFADKCGAGLREEVLRERWAQALFAEIVERSTRHWLLGISRKERGMVLA